MIGAPLLFWIRDFFRLTRIWNLIIIIFTQASTTYFLILTKLDSATQLEIGLIFFFLGTVLIAAGGYVINDYYDVKIDYVNKPEKVIVGKYMKRRYVMLLHIVLTIAGLFMGFFVSLKIMLINLIAAFLLWLYSNYLKRLPLVGNVVVSFLAGLTVLSVGIYYSDYSQPILFYSAFAFFYTLIREIIKDIQDMKGDEIFGCKTLPIIIGLRKTKWILYGLSIFFIVTFPVYVNIFHAPAVLFFYITLIIVQGVLFYLVYFADTKSHFYNLSLYCKWIMLGGILSMIIFK